MKIDLSPLYQSDEVLREYEVSFGRDRLNGWKVLDPEPLVLKAVYRKDNRTLEVSGSGRVKLRMPCDRCLKPTEVPVCFSVDTLIRLEDLTDPDGEPVDCVEENTLDTDLLLEPEILTNLPMKVLCREDCKGLCPGCGADLNGGPCGCGYTEAPGRMAEAIRQAFEKAGKN
ncbi:MAG: DUF177 domain-containing protein [Lachnospiraceae bacterium]|nr:DUF177 domain-containing protein [Lachnospiraceae bacterium]